MKQASTILLFMLVACIAICQSPVLMNYQMVVQDNSGNFISGSLIGLRLSILHGSETGAEIFAETHSVSTNPNGLISVQIGGGINVFGSLSAINWATGPFFLRAQTDPTGGANYSIENSSQLVSVPYSFYSMHSQDAQYAGNGFSHVSETGDTLYFLNGSYIIVPEISNANGNSVDALGCTNSSACNYNSSASQDDGSCYFIGGNCDDGISSTTADVYNSDCICEGSIVETGTLHSCGAANVHNPYKSYGSMTDQQGNTYKTIIIGNQEWMAENLNTSIYRNGDSIVSGLSDTEWQATQAGAWAYYNDDSSSACPYGKLYNWYAVNDARGLCPLGWHVPTDTEWTTLIGFLDPASDGMTNYVNTSGRAMKSFGTMENGNGYWNAFDPSVEGTNSSGFSSLPGGYRFDYGPYGDLGNLQYLWSSTQFDANYAWYRYTYHATIYTNRFSGALNYGIGVRCLRNDNGTGQIPGCNNSSACNYNSSASQDDGSCYFIGGNCDDGISSTTADVYNSDCICEGSIVETGTLHSCGAANVHNPYKSYGSMTDQQGNTYKTIIIGNQEWMAENLNTSIYRNGEEIITNLSNVEWQNTFYTEQGAFAYYNNDSTYACPFGKLYNWYACVDPRGLCPAGWHVPTDDEWNTMIDHLDPIFDGGTNLMDTAGRAMKSVGTIENGDGYWLAYTNNDVIGTNSSGFSGLPGGHRYSYGGYDLLNYYAYFWTSSPMDSSYAWYRLLYYWETLAYRHQYLKHHGFSVRCARDDESTGQIPGCLDSLACNFNGQATQNDSSCYFIGDACDDGNMSSLSDVYNADCICEGIANTSGPMNIPTVVIPGGAYIMGSPLTEPNRATDEVEHEVTISPFLMSVYEITNDQFAIFLNDNSIGADGLYASGNYPWQPLIADCGFYGGLTHNGSEWQSALGKGNFPVVCVTWYGAIEFASYAGGRLPTEAEWEYACSAGSSTPFNTGDCLDYSQANYYWPDEYLGCINDNTSFPAQTQSVNSYAPNAFGLYNMHGNVWEWCSDWYGEYEMNNLIDPSGPASGSNRVVRGGYWWNSAHICRSAARFSQSADFTSFGYGFRVAFQP